jgi:hypothetical protein
MDDAQRVLGKLEQGFAAIARTQETHQQADDKFQDELRRAMGELRDRIVDVEHLGQSVEGNCRAIVDHETRLETLQGAEEARKTARSRDSKWIKAIFAVVSLLTADHLGLFKAIGSLVKP